MSENEKAAHEDDVRRRYKLGPAPAGSEPDELGPELTAAAQRMHAISQRFKLGLSWRECVALIREEGDHVGD